MEGQIEQKKKEKYCGPGKPPTLDELKARKERLEGLLKGKLTHVDYVQVTRALAKVERRLERIKESN